MPKFLSEAWFDEVEKIRTAMGGIPDAGQPTDKQKEFAKKVAAMTEK